MSCQLMNYCHTRLENVYIQVGLYNVFQIEIYKSLYKMARSAKFCFHVTLA